MSMRELMYSQRNFLDKDLSRNAILLYGFGDGGGGPTREMTARIRRDHDLAGAPKIDFGTPDQLFDRVRKDIVDDARGETPVFHGELYLELHRGTLTAQQDMKRGCRQEESMLRVVEYLCAVASIKNQVTSILVRNWTVSGRPCCSTSSTTFCPVPPSHGCTVRHARNTRVTSHICVTSLRLPARPLKRPSRA